MNLADIGRHWARWQPDSIAIRFHGESTTWRQLHTRTDELAAGLAAQGIGSGDHIGVLMLNRPEWIDLAVAAWKLEAVIVPLNVRYTAREVAYVVDNAECRILVTDVALHASTSAVGADVRVFGADDLASIAIRGGMVAQLATCSDCPAFLCYTSGTTGDPKGAVLTHGSWNVASQAWSQAVQLRSDDRVALPFPLAFAGGLAVWLFTYWTGARLVLERAFDVNRMYELFADEKVSALFAVPVIIQQFVDHPRFASADLSSWRICSSGGAPVPVSLIKAVQARGVPMMQGFSLTEVSAAGTVLPAVDALRRVGSAGLPVMHGSVRIEDDNGRECAAGEVGEILIGGPQIMSGYWRNPSATAEALAGGRVHTGDLGYVDDEGYLYVVDRKKDMLISGGLNVYPAEIERALSGLPGIVEVAVIGVPDERWGETPLVVANTAGAPLAGAEVLAACTALLADFKLPRYLVVTNEPLPRNMSGKVLKRELRTKYADISLRAEPIR